MPVDSYQGQVVGEKPEQADTVSASMSDPSAALEMMSLILIAQG